MQKIIFIGTMGLMMGLLLSTHNNNLTQNDTKSVSIESIKDQKVIGLDTSPEDYDCLKLKRLDDNYLTYCVNKNPQEFGNGATYVAGTYIRGIDTIYVYKNSPQDIILHELFHSQSVYQDGNRDEETKAYDFQQMYLQLVKLGVLI